MTPHPKGITMSEIRAGEPPAPPPSSHVGFHQRLGLFDATMLVAGSMVGSGIFIVSADISRDVGSSGWLLVVWILTGVLTIIGALSYAELAAMMPNAGGQYIFLREAYGPLWAFLNGWTCFLVIQTGFIAAVGVAFAKYLGVLVPWLGTGKEAFLLDPIPLGIDWKLPIPWMDEPMSFFKRDSFTISAGQLVAVGVAVVLAAINTFGIEHGRWVQNLFTVSKMLGLGLLIVLGLTVAAHADAIHYNLGHVWSGITQTKAFTTDIQFATLAPIAVVLVLSGAMVGSLFSSDAWNNVTFIAAEVKNPQRTLPWGLLLGTGMVTLFYLLANVAYLTSLPINGKEGVTGIDNAKDDRVATAVLESVSPGFGVTVMAVVIMISTFGCNNGLTIMGARLYYAMARDGLFFQSCGKLNRHGVPAVGIWLQCGWSIVLIFSGSYNELLDYIIFAALFFYIVTVSAVFVLRVKQPDADRPYRAWGYPIVPAIYIVICAVIMLSLLVAKPVYSWPSFIIVLTGIPVYFLWRVAYPPHATNPMT
jgi:APA family basic amino acid/polyamine antiporter